MAPCFRICLCRTFPSSGVAVPPPFPPLPHLHGDDEAGQVVGRLAGVADGSEVVKVGSALVPVHHYHIHIFLVDQQLHNMVDPDRGRSSWSIAMDDEGGGPGDVEKGLGRWLVVVQLATTVWIGAGVKQQPNVQLSSHEAVRQVEVSEVIAGLVCPAVPLAYTATTTTTTTTTSVMESL